MTTQDIEITLPEDSIFKQLFSSQTDSESKTGVVETGLSDEDYNRMMNDFLTKVRVSQTPKAKIRARIESQEDGRKPLKFRKGFLNAPRTSTG